MTTKHPACTPQVIPGPEPISVLQAALNNLESAVDSSKYVHLSPSKATALMHEIERLQRELIVRDTAIDSAIRYQHDANWQAVLAPFYEVGT